MILTANYIKSSLQQDSHQYWHLGEGGCCMQAQYYNNITNMKNAHGYYKALYRACKGPTLLVLPHQSFSSQTLILFGISTMLSAILHIVFFPCISALYRKRTRSLFRNKRKVLYPDSFVSFTNIQVLNVLCRRQTLTP